MARREPEHKILHGLPLDYNRKRFVEAGLQADDMNVLAVGPEPGDARPHSAVAASPRA